ncbi:MAG: FHA domain-containing protein [Pirellulaceae bacterium]
MLNAKLIVIGGEANNQVVNLNLPATIGRSKDASLTVPHALVSRLHCEIRERDGILVVKDLESLNGTYVNKLKIQDEQPLLPGELLTLGSVTFRADYVTEPAQQATTDSFGTTKRETVQLSPSKRPVDAKDATVPAEEIGIALNPIAAPPNAKPRQSNPPKPREQVKTVSDSAIDFEEIGIGSPEKSISLSGLDSLPAARQNMSFVGGFEESRSDSDVDLDALGLQLGNDDRPSDDVDLNALNSFIKKNKK